MAMKVVKSVSVGVSVERAFRAFTSEFNRWWPRGHHLVGSESFEAIMEPFVGGRWYERHEDGTECDWGRVRVWDAPDRIVLSWEIDEKWEANPNVVSEVEVRFSVVDGRTLVELEHRNLEAFGDAAETVREAFESDQAWAGLLKLMAEFAEGAENS